MFQREAAGLRQAEIAVLQAKALVNSSARELDAGRCEVLADRIGKIRDRHNTAEIALEQVKALHNAVARLPVLFLRRRWKLMNRANHLVLNNGITRKGDEWTVQK